jgi:predicted SprT family Zn-dependent metalloprotease
MIIHMDTEHVDAIIQDLQLFSGQVEDSLQGTTVGLIQMSWEGGSREDFLRRHRSSCTKMDGLLNSLFDLRLLLRREVEQWQEVSQTFEGIVSSQTPLLPVNPATEHDFWGRNNIGNVINHFRDHPEAEELRQAAIEANITFVFTDEDGKTYYFGAVNGQKVPVSWGRVREMGLFVGGEYSDLNNGIKINKKLILGNEEELQMTLAHEMQHAIDYKTGRANEMVRNKPYYEIDSAGFDKMSPDEVQSYNWEELESSLAASCNERAKTEVRAHARGYAMDDGYNHGENIVNTDTVYTPEEYQFVLEDRAYASTYQDNIESFLAEQGISANADVCWNDQSQQIEVKLHHVRKSGS